jgi:hypothetical protein
MEHGVSKLPGKIFRLPYQKAHGAVRAVTVMIRPNENSGFRKEGNYGKTKTKA